MARRTTAAPVRYDQRTFASILSDLEARLTKLESPGREVYTIANGSTSRSLDVSTATAGQIAAFLGTLITDLQAAGKLGK